MNEINKQNEINNKIFSFLNIKEKKDFDRIKKVLKHFNSPEEKIKVIQVAGTNGKGSICVSLSNILIESGYKVGLFTSPHIINVNERIKINGKNIDNDIFAKLLSDVENVCKEEDIVFTRFELYVAISTIYFYNNNCDICVVEVGMGGEYDATNVLDNKVLTIIANIGYDHQEILGNTLEEIAKAKAGIMKRNVKTVLYDIKDGREVFVNRAKELNIELVISDFSKVSIEDRCLNYKNFKNIKINLDGNYQINNACVVLDSVIELKKIGYNISDENIYNGLKETVWPGRYQLIKDKPYIILDGGHNEQCISTICNEIKEVIKKRNIKKVVFVLAFSKDKNVLLMLEIINKLSDLGVLIEYIITTLNYENVFKVDELEDIIKSKYNNYEKAENVKRAIEILHNKVSEDDMVVFIGSLHIISEVMENIELIKEEKWKDWL